MYSVSAPVLMTAAITVAIAVEVSIMCACQELPMRREKGWPWCATALSIQVEFSSERVSWLQTKSVMLAVTQSHDRRRRLL